MYRKDFNIDYYPAAKPVAAEKCAQYFKKCLQLFFTLPILFLITGICACQSQPASIDTTIALSAAGATAPLPVKTTQPDGFSFDVYLLGDEHVVWHETADGFSVVKNFEDGFWYYAKCEQNSLVPSQYRVGDQLPPAWPKHIRLQIPACERY